MAYNSDWTGYQIDEAIKKVRNSSTVWDNKQDKIKGDVDQIAGFDERGNLVAKDIGGGDIATVQWVEDYVSVAIESVARQKTVVLRYDNWDNFEQVVEIEGISADESKQLIQPVPNSNDFYTYADSGIRVVQGLNSLKFTCVTPPSKDITVYVAIQNLLAI